MLEFRFTVHEYLKGTGPAEIGGIVYMCVRDGSSGAVGRCLG